MSYEMKKSLNKNILEIKYMPKEINKLTNLDPIFINLYKNKYKDLIDRLNPNQQTIYRLFYRNLLFGTTIQDVPSMIVKLYNQTYDEKNPHIYPLLVGISSREPFVPIYLKYDGWFSDGYWDYIPVLENDEIKTINLDSETYNKLVLPNQKNKTQIKELVNRKIAMKEEASVITKVGTDQPLDTRNTVIQFEFAPWNVIGTIGANLMPVIAWRSLLTVLQIPWVSYILHTTDPNIQTFHAKNYIKNNITEKNKEKRAIGQPKFDVKPTEYFKLF